MKIAIVVIVKDEAEDILPWLCWYINLGVNTIFFFDDSSSDGTKEIAQAVGRLRDVRVKSLKESLELYTTRQQQCYKEVLANHADEFDWIGFFDADEYLEISSGNSLTEFLDRPDLVGAVAINWCNYGSGGNVVKPHMPAFWAYNQHYQKSDLVNRHVKTFLRPNCWTGKWTNVHFFDVDPFLYDDAAGKTVVWSSIPGITAEEPVWDPARIMHYQCRSMEHFVERVRKRPDIPAHPSLWVNYDHAEVTDDSPRLKYYSIATIMKEIIQDYIKEIIDTFCKSANAEQSQFLKIRDQTSSSESFERRDLTIASARLAWDKDRVTESSDKVRLFALRTNFDTSPYLVESGEVHCFTDQKDLAKGNRVLVVCIAGLPEKAFLFVESGGRLMFIEQDPRLVDFLSYVIFPIKDTAKISLRSPTTKLFLSSPPPNVGGRLSASRHVVREWEEFELIPLNKDEVIFQDNRVKLIEKFVTGDRDLESFCIKHNKLGFSNVCSVFSVLVSIDSSTSLTKFCERLGSLKRYVC